jgi:hypothetical protein
MAMLALLIAAFSGCKKQNERKDYVCMCFYKWSPTRDTILYYPMARLSLDSALNKCSVIDMNIRGGGVGNSCRIEY